MRFKTSMRWRRWASSPLAVLAALVPLLGQAAPAGAFEASGVVVGTVNSSGVPLDALGTPTCTVNYGPETGEAGVFVPTPGLNTTFNFTTAVIAGNVSGFGAGGTTDVMTVAGTVNVAANGAGCDSGAFGHGTVNVTTIASSGNVVVDTGLNPKCAPTPTCTGDPATIAVNLTGTYDRIGPLVYVDLDGCITLTDTKTGETAVDCTSETVPPGIGSDIAVVALFVPTGPIPPVPCGTGYLACVKTATFAGTFSEPTP